MVYFDIDYIQTLSPGTDKIGFGDTFARKYCQKQQNINHQTLPNLHKNCGGEISFKNPEKRTQNCIKMHHSGISSEWCISNLSNNLFLLLCKDQFAACLIRIDGTIGFGYGEIVQKDMHILHGSPWDNNTTHFINDRRFGANDPAVCPKFEIRNINLLLSNTACTAACFRQERLF